MFDITGCVHLFGGEAPLCRDIVTRLAAQGFRRARRGRRHCRLRLGRRALRRLFTSSVLAIAFTSPRWAGRGRRAKRAG